MVNAPQGSFEPIAVVGGVEVDPNTMKAIEPHKRDWTRFQEGEFVEVKGVKFRVHEIGESRMVLKLVKH